MNPVSQIRQKSKFIRKQQSQMQIRRLTELQWEYIIETSRTVADEDPDKHERTLFIITALYAMYLRISELGASKRWTPKMCDFYRDHDGNWWFITVGKGNKQRQIAVSNAMLYALKRYRKYLGLSALPSPADTSPLLAKTKGKGPITSTTYIREIIQTSFDRAIRKLSEDNHSEEADSLNEATVHWLRHTGISDDVKIRPREHVHDDAGHNSRARHRSAKNKPILSGN
jgi:site-specific recombinase XerD